MAVITKYASRTDVTADYTDLVPAIYDMVASGQADPNLTDYQLTVDADTYSGYFDIEVPNSGQFNIIGSNTVFIPTTGCRVSGVIHDLYSLGMENFIIDCANIHSEWFITTTDTAGLNFENVEFIECYSGILAGNDVYVSNVNAIGGIDAYSFIYASGGYPVIATSNIAEYTEAIVCAQGSINDSKIFGSGTYGVRADSTVGNSTLGLTINDSLFYGNSYPVYLGSVDLTMGQSTLVSPGYTCIEGSNSEITIDHSIMKTSAANVITSATISGVITYTVMYLDSYTSPSISGSNNITSDPRFVNESNGDYRLLMSASNGSPAINGGASKIDSPVTARVETNQFLVFDDQTLKTPYEEFLPYVYKQGATIRFTDYGREVNYGDLLRNHQSRSFQYLQIFNAVWSNYEVEVQPAFADDGEYLHPYDWDWKTFNTTEITDENKFIVPRSIINIYDIINSYNVTDFEAMYDQITKQSVKVYNKLDLRGVSYDYDGSMPGTTIMWSIEGRNQLLRKQNAFSQEVINSYPLLPPDSSSNPIRPSGLVYIGVHNDEHQYIKLTDANTEYQGITEYGDFRWINTALDPIYHFRGIYAYKDNLYLTCTKYERPVYSGVPNVNVSGDGMIFRYSNNLNYDHYMSTFQQTQSPSTYNLASGNMYPTDLTIWEDGSILVLDYNDMNNIYKYNFAYDYALVQSAIDTDVRVLLREEYSDVNL